MTEDEREREREQVLRDLDAGRIDVEEALHRLQTAGPEGPPPVGLTDSPRRWRDWWLIPLAVSIVVLAVGGLAASSGGWWWACGGPALFVGAVGVTLSVLSRNSPWVHLRITSRESGVRRVAISLPLPLRTVAGLLRVVGDWIPGLDRTSVDELLMALDGSISGDEPLQVVVDDEEEGERVEVYLG